MRYAVVRSLAKRRRICRDWLWRRRLLGAAVCPDTSNRRAGCRQRLRHQGCVVPNVYFCGNVQISASSVARDRTRPLTIQPMSLQRWSHKSMSDSRSIASRIRFATRTRIFLAGLRANCYCSF